MKTAVIWNEIEEIKYTVLDGDYRMLHGIYVNNSENDETLENQLLDIMYDEKLVIKVKFITIDDFAEEIKNGAFLIECGFIP